MSDENTKAAPGNNGTDENSGALSKTRTKTANIALMGLFVLAVVYTLYFGRIIFIPIFFALLLNLLLSPAVDAFEKIHLPRVLGSALVITALVLVVVAAFSVFYRPAADWVDRAPESLRSIEIKLRFIKKPVEHREPIED